jgi:hypothetical protein
MTKHRKRNDTYRFNGVWGMKTVEIAELRNLVGRFEVKLADPDDADDKKWVARWLKRFQQELSKKEESVVRKQDEASKPERRSLSLPPSTKQREP